MLASGTQRIVASTARGRAANMSTNWSPDCIARPAGAQKHYARSSPRAPPVITRWAPPVITRCHDTAPPADKSAVVAAAAWSSTVQGRLDHHIHEVAGLELDVSQCFGVIIASLDGLDGAHLRAHMRTELHHNLHYRDRQNCNDVACFSIQYSAGAAGTVIIWGV
jgi:hypothetical protein